MLILCLDQALRCGWTFGHADVDRAPTYGVVDLRPPHDWEPPPAPAFDPEGVLVLRSFRSEWTPTATDIAVRLMTEFLDAVFNHGVNPQLDGLLYSYGQERRPGLVCFETPWHVGPEQKRPMNAEIALRGQRLAGEIARMAGCYGIPYLSVRRQKALKHFTGRSNWGTPGKDDGSIQGKRATIRQAQVLGWLPRDVRDDDVADAMAIHHAAASTFGRSAPKNLHLFGESAA